jgi:hypothetical protein
VDAVTTARPALAPVARVLKWALRRPVVAQPTTWALGLVATLVLTALLVGVGAPWWAVTPGAVLVATTLVALIAWRRLLQMGELPVVYVAPLSPETPGATEASLNHFRSLMQRLRASQVSQFVEFRSVGTSLEAEEAARLVEASGARGAVFGNVAASGSAATYRVFLSAPADWGDEDERADHVNESQRQSPSPVQAHALPADYRRPLEDLVDKTFDARHADVLEGTLAIRIAEELMRDGEAGDAGQCLA